MLRTFGSLIMGAALIAGPASAMAPASGTIVLRATATFSDGTTADRLYQVVSAADLDGDGVMDQGWLRVACSNSVMGAVYYAAASPRDSASGMATGKRQHGSVTIIKEWGPSTPMLGKTGAGGGGGGGAVGSTVSWDLATGKGSRVAVTPPYNIKENKGLRGDHSGASDDSAGKGAGERTADGAAPSPALAKTGYDVKKVEGTGAKTMAHDSWHEATLKEGSPNLCE